MNDQPEGQMSDSARIEELTQARDNAIQAWDDENERRHDLEDRVRDLIRDWKEQGRVCVEENGEPDALERGGVWESCAADLQTALAASGGETE